MSRRLIKSTLQSTNASYFKKVAWSFLNFQKEHLVSLCDRQFRFYPKALQRKMNGKVPCKELFKIKLFDFIFNFIQPDEAEVPPLRDQE